ncbi:MAG: hypothetical protein K2M79_03760 [Muribaculaceae bacterium]|nr:hypothetical protein [Muribaculaceae bacterium]
MNKISTLTLALACTVAVSAQAPEKHVMKLTRQRTPEMSMGINRMPASTMSKTAMKQTYKAPSRDYILGEYEVDYWDQYNSWSVVGIAKIKPGEGPEDIIFQIPLDFRSLGQPDIDIPGKYVDGVMYFYAGTPLEVVINGRTFKDDLYLYHWADDQSGFDYIDSAEAVWNGYGFSFDDDDIFAMADVKDQDGAWFAIGQFILEKDLEENPDYDPNEGWTSLGKAMFQDGWVLPGFLIDQFDEQNIYEVELQQNDADKNVYRLVNPYQSGPAAEFNETMRLGYIEFDVTDPDHISFHPVNAGFAYTQLGIKKLYCQNFITYIMGFFGDTAEQVIEEFSSDTMQWGTFKDGVVHLPYFLDGDLGWGNDAMFGIQGQVYSAANWTFEPDETGFREPANMDTKIYFPGAYGSVSDVAVDASDAPVEYFNLQGIRVNRPSAGQILLRRQGTEVRKLIIK